MRKGGMVPPQSKLNCRSEKRKYTKRSHALIPRIIDSLNKGNDFGIGSPLANLPLSRQEDAWPVLATRVVGVEQIPTTKKLHVTYQNIRQP